MTKKLYSVALMCFMMVWSIAMNAQTPMTVSPESGTTHTELSEVIITFTGAAAADLGAQAANVTITSDKEYSAGVTVGYGDSDNQIKLSFDKITAEANYTINVPAGAIQADGNDVEAFTLNYTIGAMIMPTLTPEPGEVKWLTTLIYNYPVDASLGSQYDAPAATVTGPDGFHSVIVPEYDYQLGNGKYKLCLGRVATQPGEYTVTIPDSLMKYTNNNDWSTVLLPGGVFKYTVTGGETTNISVTPSESINSFNQFTVTFPDYTVVEKNAEFMPNIYIMKEGQDMTVNSFSVNYNLTVEGNTISYKNEYNTIIEPGHYYMSFPEGCLLLGDNKVPNAPFMVEFDIVEPEAVNIVITPADGSTVNMLTKATIQFPDNDDVELNASGFVSLSRIKDDGSTYNVGSAYGYSSITKVDNKTYVANFSGMPTENGKYMITLARNSFAVGTGFNQEVSVTVNFVAPELVTPVLDPANNSTLDKIQNFTVTFPTETVVKINNAVKSQVVLYKGAEITRNEYGITNSQAASAYSFTPVEGTTNSFAFSLSNSVIEAGDYTMLFPAGLFLMGEDEHTFNAAAEFHYSATGEGVDKVTVTPSAPVTSLQEITVTYINETSIKPQSDYVGFSIYKVNTENSWDDYKDYTSNVVCEGNKCTITFANPFTEAGEYYIDITAWSFYLSDGVTNCTPQRLTFIVDPNATGITEVNANNDTKAAYNLAGQRVMPNAKGLVIINGKKYFNK